jgi:phosphodiesterase/alkaline phosphatase D-like protein
MWWTNPSSPYETAMQTRDKPGIFYAMLTDLKPNTTYYYKAKAQGDREIMLGDIQTFVTATKPPTVTTLNADTSSFSASLHGTLTSLGSSISVTVSFEYGLDDKNPDKETLGIVEVNTGSFSSKILNLTPGTTYYFRAKAVADGTGYGEINKFTTNVGNRSYYQ